MTRVFCAVCGNLLLVEQNERLYLYCQACPYRFRLERPFTSSQTFERKQVDDVLGGAEAWKNVDQTDGTSSCYHASCPILIIMFSDMSQM